MFKKFTNKKGFTLMEMLIVVAIIAVLVAIAIPTLSNQLEKAREATDAANLRAAYAECAAAMISDTTDAKGYYKEVNPVQTTKGFAHLGNDVTIGGKNLKTDVTDIVKGTPIFVNYAADGTCTITAAAETGFESVT